MKPTAAIFMPIHTAKVIFSDALMESLARETNLLPEYFPKDSLDEQLSLLKDVEVMFTGWHSPRIDARVLEAAPKLKAVFHCAGSVNPYTSGAFWESGIPISSAYHANSIPVAEFTYSQIVLALKGYWQSVTSYKTNRQIPVDRKSVTGTRGATIGLISLGSIARLLVEKLSCLDINVLSYDPYVSQEDANIYGVEMVELDELFRRSNVVSCHAPLTEDTKGLVKAEHLKLMPEKASFINTARGQILDTDGLVEVLQERPDLFGLLDVTFPEPLPKDSRLFDLPNVQISAHIAGSVGNECMNLSEAMFGELKRFLAGHPLEWEIKRERAVLMT